MQTDKTAGAPLLQLVCVESLRRLGANDSQTDNPAGWAFPLHCATLYWSRCEWSSPHYESLSRVREGTTELLPTFVEGLKCSWEESLHSTHGCTPVSPGHPKTSESTYNRQSSCPVAPICLPQAGISLHAHMLIQADAVHPSHALVSMCRVTCFVVPICMFIYMAMSRLHGRRSVLNSLWTLFPLVVFLFLSPLLKGVKARIQYRFSHPLSHLFPFTLGVTAGLSRHYRSCKRSSGEAVGHVSQKLKD